MPMSDHDPLAATARFTPRTELFRGEDMRMTRKSELIPNIDQGLGEAIDQRIVMKRRRRDPQPLQATRYRRIIDRLDIDAVFRQQEIACHLAFLGVADM